MIVFLDFDGVLHSFTERHVRPYRDLQSLETVLREYPDVSIAITGSQRAEQSLDELRAHFSRDLAARVVGVTPVTPIEGAADRAESRYREILLYLDEHPASHWVALDDDATLFPPACPNLILCENGFDMFAAMELQSRLNAAQLAGVPVIEREGRPDYVRLSDIPQPWQDTFRAALRGSCCPLIDGEGDCAWAADWTDWLDGRFPR
jgi:hypothetical protein